MNHGHSTKALKLTDKHKKKDTISTRQPIKNQAGMETIKLIFGCLLVTTYTHAHTSYFNAKHTITRTPDVYENKLRPEFGVNFKFNGILYHNLDRVWVVTKVPIPDLNPNDLLNMDTVDKTITFDCLRFAEGTNSECEECRRAIEMVRSECQQAKAEWNRLETHEKALKDEFRRMRKELWSALPELYPGESDQSGPDSNRNLGNQHPENTADTQQRNKRTTTKAETTTPEETKVKLQVRPIDWRMHQQKEEKENKEETQESEDNGDLRGDEWIYERMWSNNGDRVPNYRPDYNNPMDNPTIDNENPFSRLFRTESEEEDDWPYRREDRWMQHLEPAAIMDAHKKATNFQSVLEEVTKPKEPRQKRAIGAILGGLFTIASETVSFILQKKRQEAVDRANREMIEKLAEFSKNKIHQLGESQVMYGQYSLDGLEAAKEMLENQDKTIEMIIKDIEDRDKWDEWNRGIPAGGKTNTILARTWYRQKYKSLMEVARDRNIYVMNHLMREFDKILVGMTTLSKGRIPQQMIDHTQIKDMVTTVEEMLKNKFPAYRVALDSVNQYYDMKLATVMADPEERTLLITFPIFIRPYSLPPMSLYEIETVPVPIEDLNMELNSYTRARMEKPYIAANEQYYIQLRIPELRMCKIIDHKYFCEEIFLMKHKTKHSCESALLYELPNDLIKRNCDFDYYLNTTVTPAVLDGGETIVLANFGSKKKLNCEHHHGLDIPLALSHHEYQIVDRSILCACQIEADLIAVLRSVSACKAEVRKLPPLYFTTNSAFDLFLKDYVNKTQEIGVLTPNEIFSNITQQLAERANQSRTKARNPYPFSLKDIRDPTTNKTPHTMKKLMETIEKLKEQVKEDEKRHNEPQPDLTYPEIGFLKSAPVMIFEFATSLLTLVAIGYVIYNWCKVHKPLTPLMAIVGTAGRADALSDELNEMVACPVSTLSYLVLAVTFISAIIYTARVFKRMTWLKGDILSETCTIELWIWHGIRYVPITVHQLPGHCTLFQRLGYLQGLDLTLTKKRFRDTLEIDWNQCQIYYKTEELTLPAKIDIRLRDKLRVRNIMDNENYFRTQIMIRTGKNLFQVPNCVGPRMKTKPRITPETLDRMIEEEEMEERKKIQKEKKGKSRQKLTFKTDSSDSSSTQSCSPQTSTDTCNTTTPSTSTTDTQA